MFAQTEKTDRTATSPSSDNKELSVLENYQKDALKQRVKQNEHVFKNNSLAKAPGDVGLTVEMGTSVVNDGYAVIGDIEFSHIAIDPFNIQSKYGDGTDPFNASLYLNDTGGSTFISANGSTYIGDLNASGEGVFNAFNSIFVDGGAGNVGIGISNPVSKFEVQGDASAATNIINSESNYTGNTDVRAVRGYSITNPGYGIGGEFIGGYMGARNEAQGTTGTFTVYGSYNIASNSSTGTAYGVYGTASSSGGGNAYAVYAAGDLKASSQLFVGTTATDEAAASSYEVLVDGEIICEDMTVELSQNWPDYVFKDDYDLMPLGKVEQFITQNGHLPNMPSEQDVYDNMGFSVEETTLKMLEKIEELTLYMIELKKENEELRQMIEK